MAMLVNDSSIHELAEVLAEKGLDGLGRAVEIMINEAMKIERERHLNAAHHERTDTRTGYANGYKQKGLFSKICGCLEALLTSQVDDIALFEGNLAS